MNFPCSSAATNPSDHAVQHGLEHELLGFQGLPRAEQFLGLPGQVGFGPLAFGNVMQDGDPSAQIAPSILQWAVP